MQTKWRINMPGKPQKYWSLASFADAKSCRLWLHQESNLGLDRVVFDLLIIPQCLVLPLHHVTDL